MIRAGIIGATGYAGVELVRILLSHPNIKIAAVGSHNFKGQKLSAIYPALRGICDMVCVSSNEVIQQSDVVFACLPHGLSQELAGKCIDKEKVFIDLGADFRLEDEQVYTQWYDGTFDDVALHKEAVYGLPELFRASIKEKTLIANPGCYPTAATLALYPAIMGNLISTDSIIIDAKSGVTGAGRALSQSTHFPDCNEGFSPYKVAMHRHTPEIEQNLSKAAEKPVTLTFVPHLLPINRGILITAYAKLEPNSTLEQIYEVYQEAYKSEPFIRLVPNGETVNLRNVKYSNYCDISIHVDARTHTLVIVSAIDNMIKGASGQAVQNMNIVYGLPEETGLLMVPPSF